jgi:hypothetical protein
MKYDTDSILAVFYKMNATKAILIQYRDATVPIIHRSETISGNHLKVIALTIIGMKP